MLARLRYLSLQMVSLYHDPTGERIFETGSGRVTSMLPEGTLPGTRSVRIAATGQSSIDGDGGSSEGLVVQLRLRVKELETLLREQQVRLERCSVHL